ncbi:M28 family peptidase [Solirubrobacter taibaiensis]|nr:M28 family peptidase [Solirubrobacter taibaiensis]
MRKNTLAVLAVAVLGATAPAVAQADPDTKPLRDAVNRGEVLRYAQRLQAIGMANENQRSTASAGNFESLDYVVQELRDIGYNPTLVPYANTSAPNTWSERTPAVLETATKTYTPGLAGEIATMTWSTSGDINAQVIPVNRILIPPTGTADSQRSGCALADFPATVKDNIALVQRGGCTFIEKAVNARAAGAKAVLVMNEGQTGRTGSGSSATARFGSLPYPGLMAAGLSYAAGKELYDAAQLGPVNVHLKTDVNLNQRIDYDIIAETEGGDPNRMLMVGAHIDGVTAGPGINDDGSGTAMNLAIANQIKQLGVAPKYKIRFGWFSGEEQGLFGSQAYANQLNTLETSRFLGMLDYDMLASTNYIPFVYTDGTTSTPPSAEAVLGGNHSTFLQQNLGISSTPYIFDNRSDYAGFRTRGVPATGLYTGAETVKSAAQVAQWGGQAGIQADPCYHEWCDTVFNLSEYGMNNFTDALANGVWSFAGPGAIELPVRTDN